MGNGAATPQKRDLFRTAWLAAAFSCGLCVSAAAQTPTPTVVPTPGSTECLGDCDDGQSVTVDEVLTLVNIALGNAEMIGCSAGDGNDDNQITIDEILSAVNNALIGCPTPTVNPIGPIQITNTVFSTILPLVGTALPAFDTVVGTALTQGLDPLMDLFAAAEPSVSERIPNGVRLNFGSGTPLPAGTFAGILTATYANVVNAGSTISFDTTFSAQNFALNGAGFLITNLTFGVSATQKDGGKSTLAVTVSGSGANPTATVSGNALVDTARCPNYPVGGMITTTIGGTTATIRFNSNCNGTFGFSSTGARQINFSLVYFSCWRDSWYSTTQFLVAENGYLSDDLSDDEPPNLTVGGTLSDTDVNMRWESKCRTATCDPTVHMDGTFIGHFWKEEEQSGFGTHYLVRYFIGTYTSHYAKYNQDGSLKCEATRILTEQDGMDDNYHFWEIRMQ